MDYLIDSARVDEAPVLARALLTAWLQTYPDDEAGIDEAWIREHRGAVTKEGIAQWQEFIEAVERRPDRHFCRVVRFGNEIVGLLCGRREEAVDLGPMHLLREAQGHGIGSQLMEAFLSWAGDAPVRLWVTTYNERAIRFYRRYGFEATGESQLWRDRLPNIRMARRSAPEPSPKHS